MNKKKLAKALLEVCEANGIKPGDKEDDLDFLGRMLPVIASDLQPEKKLTPQEVAFFQMTDKALVLLYKDLGYDSKEVHETLEGKPREQIARELGRLAKSKGAIEHVHERLFASQITVHQYNIEHPPFPKQAQAAFKKVLGRDIFSGEGPDEGIGSQYVPISATILNKHVYCVTLARTVKINEHVNSRFQAEDVARLQMVHIVIDPQNGAGEFRGPVSQKTAATNKFLKLLSDGGHECSASAILFDADDANALVEAISARGRKVEIWNRGGAQSGTGRKILECDTAFIDPKTGRNDYFLSEDFKKEMKALGEDEHIWDMGLTLDYDGKPYLIDINLTSSSLRFSDASTTDSVIRFVTHELTRIRRERERAEKKKGK